MIRETSDRVSIKVYPTAYYTYLETLLLMFSRVLKWIWFRPLVIARSNWSCVYLPHERFFGRILVCGVRKTKLCKNWSQTTMKLVAQWHYHRSRFWQENFVQLWNSLLVDSFGLMIVRKRLLRCRYILSICHALWAVVVIGLYCFRLEAGHNGTVNGARYIHD